MHHQATIIPERENVLFIIVTQQTSADKSKTKLHYGLS